MPLTRMPIATTLAAAALALSACGDDESDTGGGGGGEASEATPLAIKIEGTGKKTDLTVPQSVEAGLVELQVENAAKGDHGVLLGRYDEGHTGEELIKAGNAWGDGGKPLPDWVHLEGGSATLKTGTSGAATVVLEPGNYVAFNVDTKEPSFKEFEVTGDAADAELPSAPGSLQAKEYSFTASGLKPGKNSLLFENTGKQPHFAAAIAIKEGSTLEDVKKFFETEKGAPPIDESKSFDTPVIDGGRKQLVDVDLAAGKYAVICFIPDREGGPPHVERGMISEVEVR